MKEISFKSGLEWKVEGVIDDESEAGDCDEVNQEQSEQIEVNEWRRELIP